MDNKPDYLKDFQNTGYLKFEKIVKPKQETSNEEFDSFMHALIDISEAFSKIYYHIIPSVINSENIEQDKLEDLLFDMRSEFRHIEYHIKDGNLSKW